MRTEEFLKLTFREKGFQKIKKQIKIQAIIFGLICILGNYITFEITKKIMLQQNINHQVMYKSKGKIYWRNEFRLVGIDPIETKNGEKK